jgi:hypothetical protein
MSIVSQILANPDRYSVQELQQSMQSGMIPGYVAIPLIQDKVQKQQRMQMAMQGQGAPGEDAPTVAEDVLQQADQSQGLPMLESNLPAEEQSYAPGGIVAFEHGGQIPRYANRGLVEGGSRYGFQLPEVDDYSDFSSSALLGPDYEKTEEGIAALAPYANLDAVKAPKFNDDAFAAAVKRYEGLTGGLPGSKDDIGKVRELIAQRQAQAAEDAKTAKERNIIGLLANIAANPSQYSSVAIGAGTAKSLPEFAATEAAQRKQQMEDAMAGLSLTKAEREEAMANITGGMGLYKTELEEQGREYTANARLRAAQLAAAKEKNTDARAGSMVYAKAFAREKLHLPYDKLNDAQRELADAAGWQKYQETAGASLLKGQAALTGAGAQVTQAGTGAAKAGTDLADKARDNIDKSLSTNWLSPENKRIRELQKQDKANGTSTASEYVQSLYKAEYDRLSGQTPTAQPTAQPTAKPAPKSGGKKPAAVSPAKSITVNGEEAVLIGVSPDGRNIYQGKSGKQYAE